MALNIPTLPASPGPAGFVITGVQRAAVFLMILAFLGGTAGGLTTWFVLRSLEIAGLTLGVGLVLGLLCLLFLINRYRNQPVLHYLHALENKVQYVASEVREIQVYLNQLNQHRQVLDSQRRTQVELLKPVYREKSADLNALFLGIDERERKEINAALAAYQEAYIRTTIAEASIRRVRVPGFTTRILERLEDAGILTAVDVTAERLKAIPNLDPFLIQELDLWRQRIERDAQTHRPLSLPAERLDPIHARFQEERMAVKASIEGLVVGMQNEVLKIEKRVGDRVVQTNALEENLHARLTEMSKVYVDLRGRLRPMRRFTFGRYFLACLGMG